MYGVKDTAELKQLLEWQEQRWGADHPKVIASLEAMADLLQMQGKFGEAEPIYWQILEKKHKLYGENDLRVADTIYDLACLHEKQENLAECERLYKWTCDIRCKLLPQGDAQLDDSVNKAKEIAVRQGHDFDETSIQAAETAPARSTRSLINFDWEGYIEQCRTLIMERNYVFAEKFLTCLVDVAVSYEPGSTMQAECLHLLGRVQFHQRNLAESLRSFERTLALYERIAGASSSITAACLEDMGDVHCKLSEQSEAEFLFNWALQICEALPEKEQQISRLKVKLESLDMLCSSGEEEEKEISMPASEIEAGQLVELGTLEGFPLQKDRAKQKEVPVIEMPQAAEDGQPQSQDQVAHFLWSRWISTGKVALEKGDLVGAEMLLTRGLDKANEFGYQDPRLWQTLCDMADLHIKQSKFVKAESMLNTAQQYCEKTLGPMHPKNAVYWEKLGRLYESQQDNHLAVICFDKLVTILVKDNRPLVEYGIYLKKLERLHEKAPASFFE